MALRPNGMTDEEYKKLNKAPAGAATGAMVGNSLRTAANFGGGLVAEIAKPPANAFNATMGALDRGVVAANNFVASAVAGRPVNAMAPIAGSAPAVAAPKPAAPKPAATAAPAPRTAAQLDQASQAEVAARNAARRPGQPQGAGASSAAGTAALPPPKRLDPNTYTNGAGVTSRVAMPGTMAAASNPVGSVQSQNFGNAAVPQPQAGIARPGAVASTYGLSVLDPRANDQIQRPQVQLGPNQTSGNGAVRGADQMAEQYNAREDREASKALASQLDSERFRLEMIAGNPGRRGRAAIAALGENAQQRAALAGGAAQLSAGAVQGRANRDNQFGISEMEQQAAERRAMLDADVTREGQQLGYQSDMARTAASTIQRPETVTTADGTLMRVGGDGPAQAVVDAQGNPVRGAQTQTQQRDYSKEADDKLIADLLDMQRDPMTGALAPGAVQNAQQQFQQLRAAQNPQPAAQPPAAGTVKNGYRFKGGDPANKANWEQVK